MLNYTLCDYYYYYTYANDDKVEFTRKMVASIAVYAVTIYKRVHSNEFFFFFSISIVLLLLQHYDLLLCSDVDMIFEGERTDGETSFRKRLNIFRCGRVLYSRVCSFWQQLTFLRKFYTDLRSPEITYFFFSRN